MADDQSQAKREALQFEKDTTESLNDIAATPEGREVLLRHAASLKAATEKEPTAGSSATPPGLEALAASMKAIASAVSLSVSTNAQLKEQIEQIKADKSNKKKRQDDSSDDDDRPSKSAKEDPIPSPYSRPFGKGGYEKEDDVLFSKDGELS